jgi:hypothetical protein
MLAGIEDFEFFDDFSKVSMIKFKISSQTGLIVYNKICVDFK